MLVCFCHFYLLSRRAKKKKEAIGFNVTDYSIVIPGSASEDITIRAIKYFATNFVGTSTKEGTLALDAGFKTGGIADTSTTIKRQTV